MSAKSYLRKREWSMGNGQCPDCEGAHEGWYGHPCYQKKDSVGHKPDCPLAKALADIGESPLYLNSFEPTKEQEADMQKRYGVHNTMWKDWINRMYWKHLTEGSST